MGNSWHALNAVLRRFDSTRASPIPESANFGFVHPALFLFNSLSADKEQVWDSCKRFAFKLHFLKGPVNAMSNFEFAVNSVCLQRGLNTIVARIGIKCESNGPVPTVQDQHIEPRCSSNKPLKCWDFIHSSNMWEFIHIHPHLHPQNVFTVSNSFLLFLVPALMCDAYAWFQESMYMSGDRQPSEKEMEKLQVCVILRVSPSISLYYSKERERVISNEPRFEVPCVFPLGFPY